MLEFDKKRYNELHDNILEERNMLNILYKYNRNDTIIIQYIFIDEIARLIEEMENNIYTKGGLATVDMLKDQMAGRLGQLRMVTDYLMMDCQYEDFPDYEQRDRIRKSTQTSKEKNNDKSQ